MKDVRQQLAISETRWFQVIDVSETEVHLRLTDYRDSDHALHGRTIIWDQTVPIEQAVRVFALVHRHRSMKDPDSLHIMQAILDGMLDTVAAVEMV